MQIVQPADPFPRFLFVNPKSGGQIGEVAHQAFVAEVLPLKRLAGS